MSRASRTLIQVAIGIVVAVAVLVGGVLYPMWRRAVDTSRDARADPHHIAGNLHFVGHVTPSGFDCTTWTFTVRDQDRDLRVVHRCGLEVPYTASLVDPEQPPGIRAGFEQTIAMLRNLPVDIWLTSPGREYGRFRKHQESLKADDPAAPFIDPHGYRTSIDQAEAAFRTLLAEQQQGQRR